MGAPAVQMAFLYPVPRTKMKPGPHWGAPFVAREFFRALFAHAPYDGYLFFSPNQAETPERLDLLAQDWGIDESIIEAHHVLDLPEVLADAPIQALHGLGNHLHPVAYARSLVSDARFPVTCSASSSPSYHWALAEHGQDLTCGLRPGDAMICMSDAAREVHREIFAHLSDGPLRGWQGSQQTPEMQVIPIGIDVERYNPDERRGWRQRLNIPAEAFVVTSLGRLSPADKTDLKPVLRAFHQAVTQAPPNSAPIYWIIAGSDYKDHARELAAYADALGLTPGIRFVVDLPEADKPALLAESDCFLALPDNPQEAFGYSVLEALACGLPVVASDWNGLKETVSADVGFRVPTYWGPALARLDDVSPLFHRHEDELMHLLTAQSVAVDVHEAWRRVGELRDDPALRQRMGKAARDRAEAVFAWPAIIARHVAVWEGAAAKAAAAAKAENAPTLAWTTAFQKAFRHYPTRWLDDSAVVERVPPTPLPPGAAIRPYDDVMASLSPGFMEDLLRELGEPRTIGHLIHRADAEADVVYFHVLWLVKQGILRIIN